MTSFFTIVVPGIVIVSLVLDCVDFAHGNQPRLTVNSMLIMLATVLAIPVVTWAIGLFVFVAWRSDN
jgi:uncharacterized membrane protein YdcZ (DUF606 family)